MLFDSIKKGVKVRFEPISPKVTLLQPVQKVANGMLSRGSEFQVFDIAGSLSQFHSIDFDVVSLESVGAFDQLKLVYMSTMSDMNVADKFENFQLKEMPNNDVQA